MSKEERRDLDERLNEVEVMTDDEMEEFYEEHPEEREEDYPGEGDYTDEYGNEF